MARVRHEQSGLVQRTWWKKSSNSWRRERIGLLLEKISRRDEDDAWGVRWRMFNSRNEVRGARLVEDMKRPINGGDEE
jgi:hypothetical protein